MKPAIQIIGLLCLFFISQLAASVLALFLFNIPRICSAGIFDVNLLGSSAWAAGFSMILSGLLVIPGQALLRGIDYKRLTLNGNEGKTFGYTLLLMLPAIFLINLFFEALALEDKNKELFGLLMHNPLGVAAIILTGPLTEEIVFRMGIQTGLFRMGLSPRWSIIASALIFGLIHANPAQIPGATAFGLILGWLYLRSGSIWVPVAAHVMNNLAAVMQVWFCGNAGQTLTDLCGGTWPAAGCAVLSAALFAWVFRKLQYHFPHPEDNMP